LTGKRSCLWRSLTGLTHKKRPRADATRPLAGTNIQKFQRVAYNKKNKLTVIIEIQELTLEHTRRGVTQEWLFRNMIRPTYRISKRTYYSYLSCNAKRELNKMEVL